ncbi:DUF2752 domain-containing protein [Kitasatospora sp. NPDC008115]|uniref:DUF2752 domain-containing protein n=1 Tax=Kitasatospora sp. NPDC008115 TaxID=3364022 RepID=UPI0036F1580F
MGEVTIHRRGGRLRTAWAPVAVLAAGAAGAAYLWSRNPHLPGQVLPFCPFHKVTGLQCPGCGGTRMVYDLLHGDLAAAWHDNAALLLVLPPAAAVHLVWLRHGLAGRLWRPPALGRRGTAVLLGLTAAWTIGRNLF